MTEPRIVRCQYGQDPHPIDDECVNVTDVWTDAQLEAGLRRVFAAVDGPPPKVEARPGFGPGFGGGDSGDGALKGDARPTWENPASEASGGDR
ncbi:hypothetical protein [Dactylosporangium sp. CA-139066]|uniref:hypothetical protein n=1 Tax=Dactylosporangium sp. CA-139066 TaxID=3239930 RepID=UPI003D89B2FE